MRIRTRLRILIPSLALTSLVALSKQASADSPIRLLPTDLPRPWPIPLHPIQPPLRDDISIGPAHPGNGKPYILRVDFPEGKKGTALCHLESLGLVLGKNQVSGSGTLIANGYVQIPKSKVMVRCTAKGYDAAFAELSFERGIHVAAISFKAPEIIAAPEITPGRASVQITPPELQHEKVTLDGQVYDRFTSSNASVRSIGQGNGAPEVPTTTFVIALPADARVLGFKILAQGPSQLDEIQLLPWNDQVDNPMEDPKVNTLSAFAKTAISPQIPFQKGFVEDRVFNLYRMTIPLLRYDPAHKRATLYKDIRVDLSLSGSKTCFTKFNPPARDAVDRFWAQELTGFSRLLHPQQKGQLQSCPDEPLPVIPGPVFHGPVFHGPSVAIDGLSVFESPVLMRRALANRQQPQMLIVTSQDFKEAADQLAFHKQDRGIDTQVLVGSFESAAALKDLIVRHAPPGSNVRWVLLMGDVDRLPTYYEDSVQSFFADAVPPAGDIYFSQIPEGETSYSLTLKPNFAIGRIPVKEKGEAQEVVEKIIAYESHPTEEAAYYQAPTLAATLQLQAQAAGDSGNYVPTATALAYAQDLEFGPVSWMRQQGFRPERIYKDDKNGIQPARWSSGETIDPETLSEFDPSQIPERTFHLNGNQSLIDNAINRGSAFVLHRGHGNLVGWSDPGFRWSAESWDVAQQKQPMVMSINCLAGHFDNETVIAKIPPNARSSFRGETAQSRSLGESLILSKNGAIGVIGSNRTSSLGFNRSFSRDLSRLFFPENPSETARESIHLGDMLKDAKEFQRDPVPGTDLQTHHTNLLSYNLLGDPSLELSLRLPFRVVGEPQLNLGRTDGTLSFKVESSQCPSCASQEQTLQPIVVVRDRQKNVIARALASSTGGSFSAYFPDKRILAAHSFSISGRALKTKQVVLKDPTPVVE